MENLVDKITGKLVSLLISGAILWFVIQLVLSGMVSIYNNLSGEKLKENVFKEYILDLKSKINLQELEDDDILKITNYYNRKSNNKFKEIGYSTILEDFYVLSMNDTNNTNDIYNKNKDKISNLITLLKKEEPYSNLPDKEKILLKNLNLAVKNSDTVAIKDNIQDLEQVMEQRYEEYKKIDLESQKNLLISYISIAVTIFIGILSIILPSANIREIKSYFQRKIVDKSSVEVNHVKD